MDQKYLIINADDLGFSKEVNRAVKECFQAGVITDTSIMPDAEYFSDAVNMIRGLGRSSMGVHLDLPGGCEGLGDFLSGRIKKETVYQTFKEQIRKVQDSQFLITHLDSHQHVHMFPGILKIVLKLAVELNIPFVRITGEAFSGVCQVFSFRNVWRYLVMSPFVPAARRRVNRLGLRSNDHAWGYVHYNRLSVPLMDYIARNLGPGITEIITHPGSAPADAGVLLEGAWKNALENRDVKFVSYQDLI